MLLLEVEAKLFNAAPERLIATVKPIPVSTDSLIMMLFRKSKADVVAVALAVWKIPEVPKFVPIDVAFK